MLRSLGPNQGLARWQFRRSGTDHPTSRALIQTSSLDFGLVEVIIYRSPGMSQPAAQKRKRRLIQLREAQRRRRNRLKEEKKTFLQIILTEEMQQSLRRFSADRARPMHVCAADLIQEGLAKYLIPEPPLKSDHYSQSTPVESPPKDSAPTESESLYR